MIKVITTVGTSIFNNYYEETKDKGVKSTYLYKSYSEFDERRSKRKKDKIKKWIEKVSDKTQISAEIKSLLKLKEEKQNEKLEVYLLATDTIASALASEIVKEILENDDFKVYYNPEFDVIKDLQVDDTILFVRRGLANLINRIEDIACGYYGNVIFNITGGYKSIIPYMTIMGTVNKCEIKYIYEDSKQLITIPQLPLKIDEEIFETKYEIIFSLENGVDNYNQLKNARFDLFERLEKDGLVEFEDNIAFLSPIGQILFKNYKNKFVWFYCTDDVFEEINDQPNIKRILQDKFFENYKNKTEIKNGHLVYDDGNNPNRIFYFEENEKIYIYKTFENHDKYEDYLKNSHTKDFESNYVRNSNLKKIRRIN